MPSSHESYCTGADPFFDSISQSARSQDLLDDLSIIFNHQSETSIISQSSEPEYLPPTDIPTALSSLDSPILWSNNPQKTWGNDHPTNGIV